VPDFGATTWRKAVDAHAGGDDAFASCIFQQPRHLFDQARTPPPGAALLARVWRRVRRGKAIELVANERAFE